MQNRKNALAARGSFDVKRMVLAAVMTALVIVFQLLATFTAFFGPFSTAMALIPIVIGAAMCGAPIGAWLGFVFGMVVLLSGGAVFFLQYNIVGTIITVLVKGTACGLVAGLIYKLLARINKTFAVITASAVCPIVNTAVFLLGCIIFFMKDAALIAEALGSDAGGMAVFWALAMGNFLIELCTNILVSPIIVRLLDIYALQKTK